jgi:hypothetical protein
VLSTMRTSLLVGQTTLKLRPSAETVGEKKRVKVAVDRGKPPAVDRASSSRLEFVTHTTLNVCIRASRGRTLTVMLEASMSPGLAEIHDNMSLSYSLVLNIKLRKLFFLSDVSSSEDKNFCSTSTL